MGAEYEAAMERGHMTRHLYYGHDEGQVVPIIRDLLCLIDFEGGDIRLVANTAETLAHGLVDR